MGLLSDVWDYCRSKVKDLIDSSLTSFKGWVNTRISDAIDGIRKVYNYVSNYVTNVYNNVSNFITNTYDNVSNYITNVVENVTKYVTNVYNTTSQYITNVVGASTGWVEEKLEENREWMRNFAKLMDPGGFLKDPLGYISAAFQVQSAMAGSVAVESFLEGFEEGLAEEVA